jgi:hypothetical protein
MKIVIGIGAQSINDWAFLGGQPAMDGVLAADVVITLNGDGAKNLMTGEPCDVFVFDDPQSVLFDCCDKIKQAWETAHVSESHLGHSAAAMWMYYWIAPDLSSMKMLVRSSRLKELREAADDYIESGFGEGRGPTLAVQAL